MVLRDNLYTVLGIERRKGETLFHLELNPENEIYKAHFPGNPITPGACIIQISKELAETVIGSSSHISILKNVKFMNVISPIESRRIDISISLTVTSEGYAIKSIISYESVIYIKLSMELSADRICVVVPVYNNAGTLKSVVDDVLCYCGNVIVVNDGSTDNIGEVLSEFSERGITTVDYSDNMGKGYALSEGFKKALSLGYDYVVTIDSDGQHFASDIPLFIKTLSDNPNALIVGSRKFGSENMPSANTFANRFSNFWFTVQTSIRLPDTQTGYRLYPVRKMPKMKFVTKRYESELEMLVRCAWKGIKIIPIPVGVYYAPEGERVTHFRRGKDFFRISVLNTILTLCAILYGYPSMLIHKIWRSR